MKELIGAAVGLALIVIVLVGSVGTFAQGKGEGHTPVVVCHWVPAHDGSFVTIVVDDDGADGNKNLQAHKGHINDVIAPEGGVCPTSDGTPDTPD